MIDAGIAKSVPQKKIDLIFYSESHNRANMSFDNFLGALTRISQAIGYSKKGTIEGFHSLIHEYMIPLYDEILKSPNYYTVSILENNVKFDEICNYLIRNVGQVLYQVYSAYFPWEVANSTVYSGLESRSEKAYKEFLKDFDICPCILTKTMAFQLWNSVAELKHETYIEMCERICNKKPKGKYFTFSKFVDILVKIAYLFARESEDIPSEWEIPSEIFIMLLEKMELSSGFLNLEKKTNKPHTSRTSLLPSKEVINLINGAKDGDVHEVIRYIKEKNAKMIQKMENRRFMEDREMIPHNVPQIMQVNSMDKGDFYARNKEYINIPEELPPTYWKDSEVSDSDQNQSMDQLHSDLIEVFEMYCSLGDPMNTQYLSLQKFMRLMESVNDIAAQKQQMCLTNTDIELVFSKATNYGDNQHQTIQDLLNFGQFMFAVELVAMKIYAYWADAVNLLIKDHILPLRDYIGEEVEHSSEHILELMEVLKDDEMVNLLELIHQTLYPYYNFYSNEEGVMDEGMFVGFWEDFKIFPDILPEESVMSFYRTLSNFYWTSNEDRQEDEGIIDEHLFVEVLALSALEMKFQNPQPSQIEKVIVLLDCMNNSEGSKKMNEANGGDPSDTIDLLALVKQEYPHLFQDS